MNDKYLVIEEADASDLQEELNKSDYDGYDVVSAAYSGSKICVILKKFIID